MNHNPCFSWNLNVWPDNVLIDTDGPLKHSIAALSAANKDQIRQQALAIGFFGFHYIRAVNENQTPLQKESLQILRRLVDASNLDAGLIKQLRISEKQSYFDYWDKVLIKVSLVLGDSHGPEIQYSMKLTFWLAAVYACFNGALLEKGSRQVKACLSILERGLSDLLVSAQRAEISEMTLGSLVELTDLVHGSKTYPTACKCMKNLGSIIRDLLCPVHQGG